MNTQSILNKMIEIKYLWIIGFAILFTESLTAQTSQTPQVKWQIDGSVIVTGSEAHTFISKVKSIEEGVPMTENDMLLIDISAYERRIDKDNFGIYEKDHSGGADQDKFSIYLKPSNSSTYVTEGNEYLIYGVTSDQENSENEFDLFNTPWVAYGYDAGYFNGSRRHVPSDDYPRLYRRPAADGHSWGLAEWTTIVGGIVAAIVIVIAAWYVLPALAAGYVPAGAAFAPAAGGVALKSTEYLQAVLDAKLLEIAFSGISGALLWLNTGTYSAITNEGVPYYTQPLIEVGMSIPVSNLDEDAGDGSDEANIFREAIIAGKKISVPCGSNDCYQAPFVPAVAVLEVKNSHVGQLRFPGQIYNHLTPYQVFENMGYRVDPDGEINVQSDVEIGRSSFELMHYSDAAEIFVDIKQKLPKKFVYAAEPKQINIEFSNFSELPTFYLIADPTSIPDGFESDMLRDLGLFGTMIDQESSQGGTPMSLYKIQLFPNDEEILTFSFPTGPSGPFLTGDNIEILHAEEDPQFSRLVINDQYDRGAVEGASLTAYGAVHLSPRSENPKPINSELSDILFWSDKGMITSDFAIVNPQLWANTPDYVFDESYHLPTLSELESFVSLNKHLPHLPGVKKLQEDGYYNYHDVLMGQLRHIEELSLHTIEQEKVTDKIEEELKNRRERLRVLQKRIEKKNYIKSK